MNQSVPFQTVVTRGGQSADPRTLRPVSVILKKSIKKNQCREGLERDMFRVGLITVGSRWTTRIYVFL